MTGLVKGHAYSVTAVDEVKPVAQLEYLNVFRSTACDSLFPFLCLTTVQTLSAQGQQSSSGASQEPMGSGGMEWPLE